MSEPWWGRHRNLLVLGAIFVAAFIATRLLGPHLGIY